MRKILSSLICKDFYFSDNSDITAMGSAFIASKSSSLYKRKRSQYLFDRDDNHEYLINKYYKWKKLTDEYVNL